jgi:hypothetical protein
MPIINSHFTHTRAEHGVADENDRVVASRRDLADAKGATSVSGVFAGQRRHDRTDQGDCDRSRQRYEGIARRIRIWITSTAVHASSM